MLAASARGELAISGPAGVGRRFHLFFSPRVVRLNVGSLKFSGGKEAAFLKMTGEENGESTLRRVSF